MAEIILEPTVQSKVIPISLRLNDTDTSLVSQLVTNRQFSTADTDAWFSFTLEGLAATTGTFDLTLINLQDKSVFNHTDKVFNTNPFYYKLDSGTDELTNEIRHAGKWVGQLVVTLANGDSATRKFIFGIEGHILDGTVVQTILLEDYNALIADIESAKDEITQYNIDYSTLISTVESQEAARVQAELTRTETFNALVDSEIIAQNVATELQNVEATYAPRLLSAEQQLAEKVGSGTKAELEDLSADVLGAIDGTGGPFNLLSIPQDGSVTPEKTSFVENIIEQITTTINLVKNGVVNPDLSTRNVGYVSASNGVISTSLTNYSHTSYIPCSGITKVYASTGIYNAAGQLVFYKYNEALSKYEYLSGRSIESIKTGSLYEATLDVPLDATHFIYSSGNGSGWDTNKVDFITDSTVYLGVRIPTLKEISYRVTDFVSENDEIVIPELLTRDFNWSASGRTLDPNGMEVSTTYETYRCSDFIPIDDNVKYEIEFSFGVVYFYDGAKAFIGKQNISSPLGTTFGYYSKAKFTTPANTAYIRVNSYNNDFTPKYINRIGASVEEKTLKIVNQDIYKAMKPLYGKTIVNFGDSILGNSVAPVDISSYISELTGATTYNCGFGGTMMSTHPSENYNPFSMCNLADAIATGDFTSQDSILGNGQPGHFSVNLARLKSINFNKVDAITIAHGTNDFGRTLENASNKFDKYYFNGALRHTIKTILTAFPYIKILLITPTFRVWLDAQNAVLYDSDTYTEADGLKLNDYGTSIKDIGKEYHVPVCDNYNETGINIHNWAVFFPYNDGTHPNTSGRFRIAEKISKSLKIL